MSFLFVADACWNVPHTLLVHCSLKNHCCFERNSNVCIVFVQYNGARPFLKSIIATKSVWLSCPHCSSFVSDLKLLKNFTRTIPGTRFWRLGHKVIAGCNGFAGNKYSGFTNVAVGRNVRSTGSRFCFMWNCFWSVHWWSGAVINWFDVLLQIQNKGKLAYFPSKM